MDAGKAWYAALPSGRIRQMVSPALGWPLQHRGVVASDVKQLRYSHPGPAREPLSEHRMIELMTPEIWLSFDISATLAIASLAVMILKK